MKIGMVSTVYKATPPSGYGGIERVVHTLAEQLVRDGHEVTLFGTPGSRCSGHTVEIADYDPKNAPSGVTRGSDVISEEPLYRAMKDHLKTAALDVVHDWSFQNLYATRHPDHVPFVISTCIPPVPGYRRPNLVACSRAHAALFGGGTRFVHYGLDLRQWSFQPEKRDPLIHLSKIAPYKGQHLTIKAAARAGVPLTLAGNIEDRRYYWTRIKPRLVLSRNIRYIGETRGTNAHLEPARGLVQTPRWFEAFPLVVLESCASGTPVIALNRGGLAEQIRNGVNGYLCENVDQMAAAMRRIDRISPAACREYAEKNFSVERMAGEYTRLYENVTRGERW